MKSETVGIDCASLEILRDVNLKSEEVFGVLIDRIALALLVVGGLNWGSVGLFQFDLVAFLFGGQAALISRVLYTIIGAAGVWSISMLFTSREARNAADTHLHTTNA